MKYSLRSLPPLSPPDGIDGAADRPRRRWYQFSLLAVVVATTILCTTLGAYRFFMDVDRFIDQQLGNALQEAIKRHWTESDTLYGELAELSEKVPDDPIKGSTLPNSQAPAPNLPKD